MNEYLLGLSNGHNEKAVKPTVAVILKAFSLYEMNFSRSISPASLLYSFLLKAYIPNQIGILAYQSTFFMRRDR
jgi:CMP-2-keto-3-deoxyoctulosonic acid synthetase